MIRHHFRLNQAQVLAAMCAILLTTLYSANSFAGDMYVMIRPVEEKGATTAPTKDMKVCVVIKDNRDEKVVDVEMLRVIRGSFGGVRSAIILFNQESFATILAHDVSDRLKFAGYDVVKIYPTPRNTCPQNNEPN